VGHGFANQTLALLRERPEIANVELHTSHLTIELRGESKFGPLVSLIVRSGGEVEEVRRGKASLEDVFLTMVWKESKDVFFQGGWRSLIRPLIVVHAV
jgi:ABC-2 type transport system ATP-binding protein